MSITIERDVELFSAPVEHYNTPHIYHSRGVENSTKQTIDRHASAARSRAVDIGSTRSGKPTGNTMRSVGKFQHPDRDEHRIQARRDMARARREKNKVLFDSENIEENFNPNDWY